MQIEINGYEEGKGKDKEALFNVANYYNSSYHEMTLRHNKYPFYIYLPYFIFISLCF